MMMKMNKTHRRMPAPDDTRLSPFRKNRRDPARRARRAVLTQDDDRLLLPRVAALEMQAQFRTLARQLAPRDKSTQDDLVQEMALACILATEPQSRSSFRLIAVWRAKDYLRWWRLQRMPDPAAKDDERELVDGELEKACSALNRLLGGSAAEEPEATVPGAAKPAMA